MIYFNSSEKKCFLESLTARFKCLNVAFTGVGGCHLKAAVAQLKLDGIIARERFNIHIVS